MSKKILISSLAILTLLQGCGGSSGSTAPDRPAIPPVTQVPDTGDITPISSENNIFLYGDENIVVGESVGFAVLSTESEIAEINWQQLQGPSIDLLANHTQTIGFDALVAGDYAIQASVRLANNTQHTVQYDFSVQENTQHVANVRLDHSVTERAKASLRVDSNKGIEGASISWQQKAGPQVLNLTEQDNNLFFDLPSVQQDQLVVFTATLNYADGTQLTDDVYITVNNADINEDGYFFSSGIVPTEDMFVANASSQYADAVKDCVYNNQIQRTCTFARLPLIGQRTETPDIDDILDRTLVSHQWMAQRFAQYLQTSLAGPDMLKLLRGVTAVVISYDVRPSFYWAATGAIYLDARNFWQTPAERDTLNEQPDFRSNFGQQLNFIIPWRYIKNNQYYPSSRYPSAQRQTRSFADLEADISWLMYHELGHANDFFPPNSWASISDTDDPLSSFRNNGTNSEILEQQYPLQSVLLKDLAQVSFSGEDATDAQLSLNGDDLVDDFSTDFSPAYYSYLNEREDYATLFERFMMAYRLNAFADVAIITRADNDELLVSWGQRGRFNSPALQDRVAFAVQRILPALGDVATLQQNIASPLQMDNSKGWFDNVVLGVSNTDSVTLPTDIQRKLPSIHTRHIHAGRPPLPVGQ